MQYKYAEIADTVYFWFAANTTAGAAGDGATPLYDVRLAGAASDAAPTASGTPTLLTHVNYSDGLYEIAIDTTGFAAGEYAVFCTLTISTVNPAGFCGSFKLRTLGTSALPVDLNTIKTQAITCGAGVTILASVGTAAISTAQTGDSYAIVNGDHGLVSIQDDVDAILADTNELQGDWVNTGRLDTILDTIATDVAGIDSRIPAALDGGYIAAQVKGQDNIDFGALQKASITAAVPTAAACGTDAASKVLITPAQKIVTDASGQVTANVKKVNDVTLQGNGSTIPWGPA